MKPETKWRQNTVLPFLKTLKNSTYEPIQQVAIIGSPDYVLCVMGRYVHLELKYGIGTESALQTHKRGMVREKGRGIAILASPKNWLKVSKFLFNLDKGIIHDQNFV